VPDLVLGSLTLAWT